MFAMKQGKAAAGAVRASFSQGRKMGRKFCWNRCNWKKECFHNESKSFS